MTGAHFFFDICTSDFPNQIFNVALEKRGAKKNATNQHVIEFYDCVKLVLYVC